MAKQFFLKNGVRNGISDTNAQTIRFTPISDGRGVIELDEEKDAIVIKSLEQYIAKRIGGVSKIDAAQFEELKKSPALSREERTKAKAPKLFEQSRDPFSRKASARNAEAAGGAKVAGAGAPANVVAAPAESRPIPAPISRGRPAVRTNKPVPTTPESPAGGANETATSPGA